MRDFINIFNNKKIQVRCRLRTSKNYFGVILQTFFPFLFILSVYLFLSLANFFCLSVSFLICHLILLLWTVIFFTGENKITVLTLSSMGDFQTHILKCSESEYNYFVYFFYRGIRNTKKVTNFQAWVSTAGRAYSRPLPLGLHRLQG